MSDTNTDALDFSAHYAIEGYEGIAFYLRRYAIENPECQGHPAEDCGEDGLGCAIGDVLYCDGSCEEQTDDLETVIAVMVGDDREHVIPVSDLRKLDEEDYCTECGQIGCAHDGRERV